MKRWLAAMFLLSLVGLLGCGSEDSDKKKPKVVMETNLGTIKIELYPNKAPITVKNFLDYVDEKHYDGTIFHRIIADFMIQGGNMEVPGLGGGGPGKPTRAPIQNESKNDPSNDRGTVAMGPHRWCPNLRRHGSVLHQRHDNHFLNRAKSQDGVGYCVFGKVIEGMDVVDKIRVVRTQRDVPEQDVIIKSIRRVEE